MQNAKPQITQQDLADGDRQRNVAFEIGILNANSTLATENPAEEKTNSIIVPDISAKISAINSAEINNEMMDGYLAEIFDEAQKSDSTEQTTSFSESTGTVLAVTNDEVPDKIIQPRGQNTPAEICRPENPCW